LEKHLFPGGAANAKCIDDESEGSPDIVMGEPSLVHDSSEVLMTNENSTGSEIDRRTPNMGARVADHVLDPEPNLPDHGYERQPRGSSLGLCKNIEVANEHEACSKSDISMEMLVTKVIFNLLIIHYWTSDPLAMTYISIYFALQEDDVQIDYPTTGRSTYQTKVSSHDLETSLIEELASKPGRHATPDDIYRTSHAAEDIIQHLVSACTNYYYKI
jgi:hypothetical protein